MWYRRQKESDAKLKDSFAELDEESQHELDEGEDRLKSFPSDIHHTKTLATQLQTSHSWECDDCGTVNDISLAACAKCNAPRPAAASTAPEMDADRNKVWVYRRHSLEPDKDDGIELAPADRMQADWGWAQCPQAALQTAQRESLHGVQAEFARLQNADSGVIDLASFTTYLMACPKEERNIESLRSINPYKVRQLEAAFSGMGGGSDAVDFGTFAAWLEGSEQNLRSTADS